MKKAYTLAAAALVAIGIGVAVDRTIDNSDTEGTAMPFTAAYGASDFGNALAQANAAIIDNRELTANRPGEWLTGEILASSLVERFKLSGDHGDLDSARELLDQGLAVAPFPSGPALSRAALALDLHQLEQAEKFLDRFDRAIAPDHRRIGEATAMRGDIAFQRGNLERARSLYEEAEKKIPGPASQYRLAQLALWTGEPERARDLAESSFSDARLQPVSFARSALTMANFSYAQGDLERAGMWIGKANEAFADFWLGQAYAAQHEAATGDANLGVQRLRDLAASSDEPEVLDILAGFLQHLGRHDEAEGWVRKAAALWEEKLLTSRESYRLHAAEHHLDFGDPERAVELAREEVAARPQGESIEVFASALLATGREEQALAWFEKAERAGYRAVSLDLARAETLDALGRAEEAGRFRRRALALNPDALKPARKLLRLGHY